MLCWYLLRGTIGLCIIKRHIHRTVYHVKANQISHLSNHRSVPFSLAQRLLGLSSLRTTSPPHVLFSTSRRSVAPPSAPRISLLGKLGHLRWHLRRHVKPEARAKRRAARGCRDPGGGVKQPFVGGLGGASHVGGLVGRMRNGILYGVHLV